MKWPIYRKRDDRRENRAPPVRTQTCPGCGRSCISAVDTSLDARVLLDEDDSGEFVIVGGFVVERLRRPPAAYTRLRSHSCQTFMGKPIVWVESASTVPEYAIDWSAEDTAVRGPGEWEHGR